jgi:hypothetical protein
VEEDGGGEGRTSEGGDQQERGIKRSRGSRGRGINRRGVSSGEKGSRGGEIRRSSSVEGYQEEKRIKGRGGHKVWRSTGDRYQEEKEEKEGGRSG